jgi:hypothetical protein
MPSAAKAIEILSALDERAAHIRVSGSEINEAVPKNGAALFHAKH